MKAISISYDDKCTSNTINCVVFKSNVVPHNYEIYSEYSEIILWTFVLSIVRNFAIIKMMMENNLMYQSIEFILLQDLQGV